MMARAEAICYGDYQYDDANTQGQSAYTLTNVRAGLRGKHAFGEIWVRNAFDTRYVPVAFRIRGSRRQDSSAKTARRGRSASAPA